MLQIPLAQANLPAGVNYSLAAYQKNKKRKKLFLISEYLVGLIMKANALILLFSMTVLLAETVMVIPLMRSAPVVCGDEMAATAESCQTSDTEEAENGDCNDKSCCRSCPVCYLFIVQAVYQWPAGGFMSEKNYAVMNEADISSFTAFIWKPPNAGLNFS